MGDQLRPWLVTSAEYGEVDIICDGQGPIEYGRDWTFVEAATAADAKVLALQLFRKGRAHFLRHLDNPLEGMRAELQLCPVHGRAVWRRDHYACDQCDRLLGLQHG